MTPAPDHIYRLLHSIRVRQHGIWIASSWIATVLVAFSLFFIATILESVAWFTPDVRIPLVKGLGIVLIVCIGLVVSVSLYLLFDKKTPANQTLAKTIWKNDPDVRDHIVNALELSETEDASTSSSLRWAAIQNIDHSIRELSPKAFLHYGSLKALRRYSLILLVIFILSAVFSGSALFAGFSRLIHPSEEFLRPGTVILALDLPDTIHVVQGDRYSLHASAFHSVPSSVQFLIDEGGGAVQVYEAFADSLDSLRFSVDAVPFDRDSWVYAHSRQYVSDSTRVLVAPRPRIARLEVTVQPPSYTSLPPEVLPEGVGDFSALVGSRISVRLESSRPLHQAKLVFSHDSTFTRQTAMNVQFRNARGSMTVRNEGYWWIELEAEDGIRNLEPLVWRISTMEDYPPSVDVRLPEDGSEIPEQMVVPLVVLADDDYGISEIALRFIVYNEFTTPDSLPDEYYASIPLTANEITRGRFVIQTLWGLSELNIFPEEEVWFFVEAWDNDDVHGPKRTRSETRRIVYSTLQNLFEETDTQEMAAEQSLEEALLRAQALQEHLEENIEQLRSNPEDMTWEERRSLEQSITSQQELAEQIQQAVEQVEQIQEQFAEHNMVSMELLERYSQLQELLEEIATPEMRQAMEELQEALNSEDGERIREALENFSLSQEQFIENLDRSISILQQLQQERQLEELANRAQELAQRQEEISERLEDASDSEMDRLSTEQERIAQDLESLLNDMERTSDEFGDTNPDFSQQLDSLYQQTEQSGLQQELQSASQSMQQHQRSSSQEASRRSEESLQRLAQQLQSMQQEMVSQNMQEIAEMMDRIMDMILILSHHQESLRNESEGIGLTSPRYRSLAARQNALQDALGVTMEAAQALSGQTFFVGAQLLAELQTAGRHMQNTISGYTDRRPREVTGEQTQTMASLHRSMRQLQNAQQQMQQSCSSTGYQEMMDQLSQMAQQQQQLNQMSQGMPMPMPMQGSTNPGGDMLSQMAAQQRALAEAMRQLEQQAQSMEDILGSLEGMSSSMEEVAEDFEERNVTERTRQLQERILQRLLDSQRSLQRRELSQERISRSSEDLQRFSPGSLTLDFEDRLRQQMLRALEGDYSPEWQNVIRDYFRALERNYSEEAPSTTP